MRHQIFYNVRSTHLSSLNCLVWWRLTRLWAIWTGTQVHSLENWYYDIGLSLAEMFKMRIISDEHSLVLQCLSWREMRASRELSACAWDKNSVKLTTFQWTVYTLQVSCECWNHLISARKSSTFLQSLINSPLKCLECVSLLTNILLFIIVCFDGTFKDSVCYQHSVEQLPMSFIWKRRVHASVIPSTNHIHNLVSF